MRKRNPSPALIDVFDRLCVGGLLACLVYFILVWVPQVVAVLARIVR